jgi:hypothetical protein
MGFLDKSDFSILSKRKTKNEVEKKSDVMTSGFKCSATSQKVFLAFKTGTHCINQAGLELVM